MVGIKKFTERRVFVSTRDNTRRTLRQKHPELITDHEKLEAVISDADSKVCLKCKETMLKSEHVSIQT